MQRNYKPSDQLTRGEMIGFYLGISRNAIKRDGFIRAECPFCKKDFQRGELIPRRAPFRLLPSEEVSVEGRYTFSADLSSGGFLCSHCKRRGRNPVECQAMLWKSDYGYAAFRMRQQGYFGGTP